jgi:hypothetical protein
MHTSHNEIEAAEDLIGVVEGTIRQDVGFNPLEDAEAVAITGVELFDRFMLCRDLLDGQSAGIVSGLRVVCDTEVGKTSFAGGFCHLL